MVLHTVLDDLGHAAEIGRSVSMVLSLGETSPTGNSCLVDKFNTQLQKEVVKAKIFSAKVTGRKSLLEWTRNK